MFLIRKSLKHSNIEFIVSISKLYLSKSVKHGIFKVVTNCKCWNFCATLIFTLFGHQEACTNLSTLENNAHIYIVYCYQNMPCAKATTHVYVKMVALQEHLPHVKISTFTVARKLNWFVSNNIVNCAVSLIITCAWKLEFMSVDFIIWHSWIMFGNIRMLFPFCGPSTWSLLFKDELQYHWTEATEIKIVTYYFINENRPNLMKNTFELSYC